MRILFVNKLYPPDVGGGAEITLSLIVSGLAARGHDVRVVTTGSGADRVEDEVHGVRVVRLPLHNLYWHHDSVRRPGWMRLAFHGIDAYNPAMGFTLHREMVAFDPDVVSFHNLGGFSAAAWDAVRAAHKPSVQVLHDYYHLCPRSQMFIDGHNCEPRCTACRVLRLGRPHASRKLSAVVGVSEYVLGAHLDAGLFSEVPVKTVIHNARVMSDTPPRPSRASAQTFGFIGTLGEWKGVRTVLEAFTRLQREGGMGDLRLLIAGTGDPDYVESLRREFPSERIEFLGRTTPHSFYERVDVSIVASLWNEPLGMVAAESLLAHVPVVGAKRGGIPEMVQHMVNGLLYEPTSPDELLACMRRLARETGLLGHLAAHCRESALPFADLERMVGGYEALYSETARTWKARAHA